MAKSTNLVYTNAYRRQVESAWDTMVGGGRSRPLSVRELVLDSWDRCSRTGVNPMNSRPYFIGEGEPLECLRERHRELLLAAKSTWDVLSDILSEANSIMVVTDPRGVMLDVCGSTAVIDHGQKEGVSPGHDWSESSAGTNAIGVMIASGVPAEVYGAEHFCVGAKIWSCSAAPIRDTVDGSLIGSIDVTTFEGAEFSHSLALALTAANQVEQTLQSRELARNVQLLQWYHPRSSRWSGRAAMLLDRKGRVIMLNDPARALFERYGANGSLVTGWGEQPPQGTELMRAIAAMMPPRLRAVSLAPYRGSGAWEGGVVVFECRQAVAKSLPPAVCETGGNHPGDDAAKVPAGESEAEAQAHTIADLERKAIIAALSQHRGNRSAAAQQLGISRSTLYRRLSYYGLD